MQLWQDEKRSKSFSSSLNPLTQKISRYFTPSILLLALLGGLYAYQKHPDQIFEVVTAILIVACPCALALSSPFVYGNLLHYFSREQFYVKNASVANRLTRINHIVFDKTGTLSFADIRKIRFIGKKLSEKTKGIITSLLQSSSHPLGQAVLAYLKTKSTPLLLNQKEVIGAGVEGTFDNQKYRLGSAKYVGHIPQEWNPTGSSIHFSIDGNYQGYFKIESQFRNGLKKLFQKLAPISISVLSGDSDHEKTILLSFGLTPDTLHFNKNPFEKIKFIEQLQDKGKFVAMLGDGLNDSGALKKSDMAIAVAPNRGLFTPACDAILLQDHLNRLPVFIKIAKRSQFLILICLVCSLAYNIIGLSFAFQALLTPLVAAVLMPLSSISVLLIATLGVHWISINENSKN